MDVIMESIKNLIGENSIGWKKIKRNQDVLDELKKWLQENNQYDAVSEKIKELEDHFKYL